MTRWFLDTEFNEDGRTIDLISLAVVSEDGAIAREWVSLEFDESKCNDWVKANVLPHLPPQSERVTRAEIAVALESLVLGTGDEPEFWAYFADYDWVALCQLYGPMVDLPKGFPHWCRDLKQLMDERGISRDELPEQKIEHSALHDARWNRDAYLYVQAQQPLDAVRGDAIERFLHKHRSELIADGHAPKHELPRRSCESWGSTSTRTRRKPKR